MFASSTWCTATFAPPPSTHLHGPWRLRPPANARRGWGSTGIPSIPGSGLGLTTVWPRPHPLQSTSTPRTFPLREASTERAHGTEEGGGPDHRVGTYSRGERPQHHEKSDLPRHPGH